jgi:hypothetical protein
MKDKNIIIAGVAAAAIALYFFWWEKNKKKTPVPQVVTTDLVADVPTGVPTPTSTSTPTPVPAPVPTPTPVPVPAPVPVIIEVQNSTIPEISGVPILIIPVEPTPTPTRLPPIRVNDIGYDGSYSKTASIMSNNYDSVTISTGFSTGVTWDLSIDGGLSYVQNGLTSSSYTYKQLSPNTTYQIVRRMYGKNGFTEVLPAVTITTAGIAMTPTPIYISPAPEYAPTPIYISPAPEYAPTPTRLPPITVNDRGGRIFR